MAVASRIYVYGICLFLLITLINASILLTPLEPGPGPCYDKNGNERKLREVWKDEDKCEMHKCILLRGRRHIQTYRCSIKDVPEGCRLLEREGLYPDCCADFVC
uniref:TxLP9 n=1 Tax=Lychas mucronatus TaxID=172552 RepID=A0A0U1TYK7_LYCMC|nr:TxLP9 [Lychas mucronatus]